MNGLSDALLQVRQDAVKANAVERLDVRGLPDNVTVFYDRQKGETFEHVENRPGARKYTASSLSGFAATVALLALEGTVVGVEAPVDGGSGFRSGVARAVLDEKGDRRDRVALELPVHSALAALMNATAGKLTQGELVDLLRFQLREFLVDESILATVRNIKFSRSDQGESRVQQGRESLGRSIEAEVTGIEGDFPETFNVRIPILANRGWREQGEETEAPEEFLRTLTVGLKIDVMEKEFTLRLSDEEVEAALADAATWVARKLRDHLPPDVRVIDGLSL